MTSEVNVGRRKREHPYAQVSTAFLTDTALSLRAKGLMAIMLSRPTWWKFRMKWLEEQSTEGREATRTAMRELTEAGYVHRVPARNEHGQMDGWAYEFDDERYTPETVSRVDRQTGNPSDGLNGGHNKKDSNKKDLSNKDQTGDSSEKPSIMPTSPVVEAAASETSPEWYMATYNELKPSAWKVCAKLTADRRKRIRAFVKEHGKDAHLMFKAALAYVSRDPYWRGLDISFDTLWTKNHVTQWAEGAATAMVTGRDPGNKVSSRASEIRGWVK